MNATLFDAVDEGRRCQLRALAWRPVELFGFTCWRRPDWAGGGHLSEAEAFAWLDGEDRPAQAERKER